MLQKKKTTTPHKSKLLIAILGLVFLLLLAFAYFRDASTHINATKANEIIQNRFVAKAYVDEHYLYLQSDGETFKVAKEGVDMHDLHKQVPLSYKQDNAVFYDLFLTLAIVFALVLLFLSLKKEKQKKEDKEDVKIQFANPYEQPMKIIPQRSTVAFSDVAGIEEVKEELEEIIDFLKAPKSYTDFGIRMPRGVLLVGPPGVGKTMIAKAVAGEANVPFFYQSGASFVHIYVGMGAKRVKELFAKAKLMAPAIIFIDEIDAVGKARGSSRNDERDATLNQLLTEMDGFEDSSEVIVIAATNKIEMLDDALLRPGRFDRRVHVGLPSVSERKKIASVYLANKPNGVDLDLIANITIGFSGAAISSLINEAAIYAMKNGKKIIENSDIQAVKDKVISGKKRVLALSQKEKEVQATYQGAKAVIASWLEVHFDKIGLINEHITGVEKEIISKNEMLNLIKVHLAGTVAVKENYGESFSNGATDLKTIKQIIANMLEIYGMSGTFGFNAVQEQLQILQECEDEVKMILIKLKVLHEKVSKYLLQNEYIDAKTVKALQDEVL